MKQLIRATLRSFGFEVKRLSRQVKNPELEFLEQGRIPWGRGYIQARDRFIHEVLADAQLLALFQKATKLPKHFGERFDERCVEYPWLVAHLQSGPEILLDAGSALNHAFILEQPVFEKKKLHILTLAPETNCFWNKGVSYLFEDLRWIPIRDAYYDTIVCLSTLEHVGCDNTFYIGQSAYKEQRSEDFLIAMQELARVLKPGGTLLLTVPFGAYRHFGSFQQFDSQLLSRAVASFGETSGMSVNFYRYTVQGWDIASEEECANCQYVDWLAEAWSGAPWPTSPRREPDLAAAARAVACVKLTKTR